jgi:hypothetical protein
VTQRRIDLLRDYVGRWLSLRVIGCLFASFVFGTYVVSLEFALWAGSESGDLMDPILWSLYAWIFVLVLVFIGQVASKPLQLGKITIGILSLVIAWYTYTTTIVRLRVFKVPWFLSFLDLDFQTKAVIGTVCLIGYLYIVYSPWLWRR